MHAALPIEAHVLLHEDGVRAGGDGGAGENAPGGPPRERLGCRRPGREAPRHRQARSPVQIREAHRVPVHGRVVERRQVEGGDHVCGEHAAIGGLQPDLLDLGNAACVGRDKGECRVDRQELAAEGEAVVGELRHRPLLCAGSH